jgi:hypothetical protein
MAKRVQRSRAEREVFWRRQFDDWQQSGQTITAFCRERGLTESAFHLWKRELRLQKRPGHSTTNARRPSAHRLVPVSLAALPTSTLTLEVHGATLRIEPGADEALLCTVLKVLKGD